MNFFRFHLQQLNEDKNKRRKKMAQIPQAQPAPHQHPPRPRTPDQPIIRNTPPNAPVREPNYRNVTRNRNTQIPHITPN